MALRWGPGPVFVYESITAARRWTYFAARTGFALALLVSLWVVWSHTDHGTGVNGLSRQELAALGRGFYGAIAGVQLAVILLAAPAAAAGSVCLDRARGTLVHMMVTDLSDAEVVLGKLGSRLAPVFALVAAAVPVLGLAGLLGGIVPELVVTLFLVTLGLGLLGCSAALAVSVRVLKAHEVLMAVYSGLAVWLLSVPVWSALGSAGTASPPPPWYVKLNPFVLAYAPYETPGYTSSADTFIFLAVVSAVSLVLTLFAVATLRREVTAGVRRSERWGRLYDRAQARLFSWWPHPSLDGNPVLWREWHRNRPSRTARRIWALYAVLAVGGTGYGMGELVFRGFSYGPKSGSTIIVNAMQVTFGLLFLSVATPTVLSDERVQGSLDVLLATPLSTRTIVLGKWWGAFRVVPRLAILPGLGALFYAAAVPAVFSPIPPGLMVNVEPVDALDRFNAVAFPVAWVLVHGAAISSVGLALSTWLARPARALALSVALYLAAVVVTIILVEAVVVPALVSVTGVSRGNVDMRAFEDGMITFSPFAGQISSLDVIGHPWGPRRKLFWKVQAVVLGLTLAFAAGLLALTVRTFDRCLGRVASAPDRARFGEAVGAGQPSRYASSSSPFT